MSCKAAQVILPLQLLGPPLAQVLTQNRRKAEDEHGSALLAGGPSDAECLLCPPAPHESTMHHWANTFYKAMSPRIGSSSCPDLSICTESGEERAYQTESEVLALEVVWHSIV